MAKNVFDWLNGAPVRAIDLSAPVMQLFEEGDWVRIVVQGNEDRFLPQRLAKILFRQIGEQSFPEKSELSRNTLPRKSII